MNKKGFTLVEVILVIVITALLLLVLVPNIFVMLNKNNEESYNNLKNNILSAAKIYVVNNKYSLGFTCGGTVNITLQTLVDSGDLVLDGDTLINPIDDSEISLDNFVKVTYDCSSDAFDYNFDCEYCNQNEENNNSGDDTSSNGNSSGSDDDSSLGGNINTQKVITITDNSGQYCASAIEYYYEDSKYKYYFTCVKSGSVIVTVNGTSYTIKEALNSGVVTMSELEDNGFTPLKEAKLEGTVS